MLKRLLIRLLAPSLNGQANGLLAGILSDADNKETFLGVKRPLALTPNQELERLKGDVEKVIRYSNSQDYAVWVKEAWSDVLRLVDQIADPKTSKDQVDFCRGALSTTLNLIRISYKARNEKINQVEEEKRKKQI